MSKKTPLPPNFGQKPTNDSSSNVAEKANEAGACEHCGALVYGDSVRCGQCKRFPVKMHQCPHCKSIAAVTATHCWKCGRMFVPDGDFL